MTEYLTSEKLEELDAFLGADPDSTDTPRLRSRGTRDLMALLGSVRQ